MICCISKKVATLFPQVENIRYKFLMACASIKREHRALTPSQPGFYSPLPLANSASGGGSLSAMSPVSTLGHRDVICDLDFFSFHSTQQENI